MESNITITNSDALGLLLKANRPVPTAEYMNRVNDALYELTQPRLSRVKSFAVRRPLAFVAILVLILTMCVGTAFALEALFRNVFGNVGTQIEERIEDAKEQYPALQEQMEGMEREQASELDMQFAFDLTSDAVTRSIMQGVMENAVVIGQQSGDIILSEFSAYKRPVEDEQLESSDMKLYFGCAVPVGTDMRAYAPTVCVDGIAMTVEYWDVPLKNSDEKQYSIYSGVLNRNMDGLPEQSLITMQMADASFCFRYDWGNGIAVVPKDDREYAAWLAEAESLTSSITAADCVCLTAPITQDGITASIAGLLIDGNVLRVSADISADAQMVDMCAVADGITVTIKGQPYYAGTSLNVVRVLPDDYDFSTGLTQKACWDVALPYHASELCGEEIIFGFTLKMRENTKDWQPEYDYTETPFDFRMRISQFAPQRNRAQSSVLLFLGCFYNFKKKPFADYAIKSFFEQS